MGTVMCTCFGRLQLQFRKKGQIISVSKQVYINKCHYVKIDSDHIFKEVILYVSRSYTVFKFDTIIKNLCHI